MLYFISYPCPSALFGWVFNMEEKSKKLKKNLLIDEVLQALSDLGGWGSVEIYVQDGKVTQITKRAIKKTNHSLQKS
jgi:hypothetical protein